MDFDDKVAIVTGGIQGIGKAISLALLKNGIKLLICDINETAGELFIEEIKDNFKDKVIFKKCDVSSRQSFTAAFEEAKSAFGKIDIVINNAGVLNETDWKRMIEINFIGVVNGIQLGFEFMGKNNNGSGGFIINIASNAGLHAFPLAPIYAGTKHGIVGLTRSFGQQYHLDKTGVTVNAVCPGPTDTNLFHIFPKYSIDKECAMEHNSKIKPISPDEVAKAVLKLLRDDKNGALLRVDGAKGTRYEECSET